MKIAAWLCRKRALISNQLWGADEIRVLRLRQKLHWDSKAGWRAWQANIQYMCIPFVTPLLILRCPCSHNWIIGSPAIPIFSDVAGSLDVVLCKAPGRPITNYADTCTAHVSRKKGRFSLARLEAPMGSLSATPDAFSHLRTPFSMEIRLAFAVFSSEGQYSI